MNHIIDGKKIAKEHKQDIKKRVEEFYSKFYRQPALCVILVGKDPASQIYVRNKKRAAKKVGINVLEFNCPSDLSEKKLLSLIDKLNRSENLDGILVQLPLPDHINTKTIIRAIDPRKDVDGFHPLNMGLLSTEESIFIPCTPLACLKILRYIDYDIKGSHAVIVNHSNIVGRPLAQLLLNRGATVTIMHKDTIYPYRISRENADILITAVGKPNLITARWMRGALVDLSDNKRLSVVLDVGISRLDDKVVGDVKFDDVEPFVKWITPVPGGVGPITISCLLENTLRAAQLNVGLIPEKIK